MKKVGKSLKRSVDRMYNLNLTQWWNRIKRLLICSFKTITEYKIEWVYMVLFALMKIGSISFIWAGLVAGHIISLDTGVELILLSITLSITSSITGVVIPYPYWYANGGRERLTTILPKPHHYIQILSETINLTEIFSLMTYLGLFAILYTLLPEHSLIMYLLFMMISFAVYSFFTLLGLALSFWYDKIGESWFDVLWPLTDEAPKYPLWKIKNVGVMVLFNFIIPIMYISVYPVFALENKVSHYHLITGILIVLVLYTLLHILFKKGLERFESVGG